MVPAEECFDAGGPTRMEIRPRLVVELELLIRESVAQAGLEIDALL